MDTISPHFRYARKRNTMAIQGSLKTMSILDLLEWIERCDKHGKLTIEDQTCTRTFRVTNKYLVGTSSNLPEERLSNSLLNLGLISKSDLEEAFRVRKDTGVLIGRILVMIGAIDEVTVEKTIKEKIIDALANILTWEEGIFHFEDSPNLPVAAELEIFADIESCIDLAKQRVLRWGAVSKIISNIKAPLRLANPLAASETEDEELATSLLFAQAGKSIQEIAHELKKPPLLIAEKLVPLFNDGMLGLERRSDKRLYHLAQKNFQALTDNARKRAKDGDKEGAFNMAKQALAKAPEDPRVRALVIETERALVAELTRTLLDRSYTPKLLKSSPQLSTFNISENERTLAERMDGCWDLLSILCESDMEKTEALIATNKLIELGVVSLS